MSAAPSEPEESVFLRAQTQDCPNCATSIGDCNGLVDDYVIALRRKTVSDA